MFVEGDILKVKPEWLSDDEKKDSKYADKEYYVRDCWDGKVDVICKSDNFVGYSIYVWRDYTMYKVGHIDAAEIQDKLNHSK